MDILETFKQLKKQERSELASLQRSGIIFLKYKKSKSPNELSLPL